jgi:hypothetical protein
LFRALRPFIFSVNMERCLLSPAIFSSLLFSFTFLVYWCACSKGFLSHSSFFFYM